MAVVFTPSSGAAVTLGGTSATGPFPNHSISCEFETTPDGVVIGTKYSITITGKLMASGAVDARRDSLQAESNKVLASVAGMDEQTGKLELLPAGGGPDNIDFQRAKLTSVELGAYDESTHLQYREVTYQFEATKKANEEDEVLADVEESWEITANDGTYGFLENDFTLLPSKTYTITHTLSATGKRDYPDGVYEKASWREARDWVVSRLQTNPIGLEITKDLGDKDAIDKFKVEDMGNNDNVGIPDISDCVAYNHNRVINSSLGAGTYGVTETWFISKESVTHELEVSLDSSAEGETTVTVNGTINGLNASSFTSKTEDKISQAEAALEGVLAQTFVLANSLYTAEGPKHINDSGDTVLSGTLRNLQLTKTVGRNKTAGVVTWSVVYNDTAVSITDALSESVSLQDDNQARTVDTIAIIAIIGKADGPIFQDMGTTPERKRNLSVEVVMKKNKRTQSPTPSVDSAWLPSAQMYTLMNSYKPTNAYEQGRTENWTPSKGSYTLTVDWTY